MRRSDRLFDLISLIRDGRLHRASDLAAKLEVSLRTVYRDMATLMASGLPIEGERGVGYALRVPIAMAPVSLSAEEAAALQLAVALLRGGADTRDVAYSEWHLHPSRCGVALKLRTVRTKKYKCTFELESGAGELYDLANDPGEMNNLFDDAGYAHVRKEMHDMMRARPGAIVEPPAEPIGMA